VILFFELLAAGNWLLAIGFWQLAIGCWQLAFHKLKEPYEKIITTFRLKRLRYRNYVALENA